MIELFAILPILGTLSGMMLKSAVTTFTSYGIKRKIRQEMQVMNAYVRERAITSVDYESEIRNCMNEIMRR